MSTNTPPPTLTDAKGMGGVNALDGFDYQLWTTLPRIPSWIRNPAFEGLIFEGIEDLEVRFFAPQAKQHRFIDRYQAKSADLSPANVREVLESFQVFENNYPAVARLQTLVTPRLPPTLRWLERDSTRVRRGRPFYAPFTDVMQAIDNKLLTDLTAEYGQTLGNFIAGSVEFDGSHAPSRDHAINAFATAWTRSFPELDITARQNLMVFDALCHLVHGNVKNLVTRNTIITTIQEALGKPLVERQVFPLRVLSDSADADETFLCINATPFAGGDTPFPITDVWDTDLIQPLSCIAEWLRKQAISRVTLSGQYRLTTAFTIGHALRSASGFELEIPTREGVWSTDDRPRQDEQYPRWQIAGGAGDSSEQLIVSVGVLRDPTSAINGGNTPLLRIFSHSPVTSAHAAQNSVMAIKDAISEAITRLRPRKIDLYFAGPAALATALGHRWNAMPKTQLHEYISNEHSYIPTALIN